MPDINGIPYVESTDLVSAYPAASQALAQEISDQLASKLPYSYGTATPSTSVDGFLWYDENDTPPTPKFWDGAAFQNLAPAGGLELITTETFSAVSTVSLNSCFSSDYANYRIVYYGDSGAASGTELSLRLRASGSDITGSNYYLGARGWVVSGSGFEISQSAQTSATLLYVAGTGHSVDFDVLSPFPATRTVFHGTGVGVGGSGSTAYASIAFGAAYAGATSADGFTLIPATSTITGTIRIYGYKD